MRATARTAPGAPTLLPAPWPRAAAGRPPWPGPSPAPGVDLPTQEGPMSPLTVTLTVANGPLVGQAYAFREPAVYVLGRAAECYPRLPDALPYKDVSRHHCLLSVQPPELRLLDLG